MELKPTEPPGHAGRKLRGFVSEMARLRAEGYTIRAIHQALTNAGVTVGWATVQREVARLAQPFPPVPPTARPLAARPAVDVEGYFDPHTTNPLFRKKGSKG